MYDSKDMHHREMATFDLKKITVWLYDQRVNAKKAGGAITKAIDDGTTGTTAGNNSLTFQFKSKHCQ